MHFLLWAFLAISFFVALMNLIASVVLAYDGNPRAILALGIALILFVLNANIIINLEAQG